VTEYVWDPLSPSQAAAIFERLEIAWWIAGGVAIDMFVGRGTREHGDLDIAMLRRDVGALVPLLDEWDVQIAHDGVLTPWDGAPLGEQIHQFWARPRGAAAWAFEILLEHSDGDDWLYRRDTRIRRPIADIGRRSAEGIPYLAAEICLLYKSPRLNIARSQADFDSAAPLLGEVARRWLRAAVQMLDTEHAWLSLLAGR
jgi:hypothetical protein